MIAYPGTNPVTVFPGTPTAGYGLWPTPVEAQGGNTRSAVNLMAMGESLTDRTNFIGWRLINIVDGGTYTFTAAVSTKNAWSFTGSLAIHGTGSQALFYADTMMVTGGKTLNIGDPGGSSGLGNVDIWDDCLVKVRGTSGHPGILSAENYGVIKIKSGGTFTTDSGGIMTLLGRTRVAATVGATTDPGDDNALMGPMLVKAWAHVTTDGVGGITLNDGYNVTSAQISGTDSHWVVINFVRNMANATYDVDGFVFDTSKRYTMCGQSQSAGGVVIKITEHAAGANGTPDFATTAVTFTVKVLGRQ